MPHCCCIAHHLIAPAPHLNAQACALLHSTIILGATRHVLEITTSFLGMCLQTSGSLMTVLCSLMQHGALQDWQDPARAQFARCRA